MKKKHFRRLEKYMIQSFVIRAFSRFVISITIALLWKRFVASMQPLSTAFFLFAVIFFVFAWMAYLRQDGLRIPKIDKKLFDRTPKPAIRYGDMIDYVDEEPHPDENLDDEDIELVTFYANLLTGAIYLILSFF